MAAVVVGVDGSKGAQAALEYAVEEAKRRGCPVKAVHVWHVPPSVYAAGGAFVAFRPEDFEQLGRRMLDDSVDGLGPTGGVTVERVLLQGQAAAVLIDTASEDDVLVVGSRGLGGFTGLLLGSVGQECARHARCPVIIVPHASEE